MCSSLLFFVFTWRSRLFTWGLFFGKGLNFNYASSMFGSSTVTLPLRLRLDLVFVSAGFVLIPLV